MRCWVLAALLMGVSAAQAQQRLSFQCPLIVPPQSAILQPRRIRPDQVAAKNAMGCLSPDDAIYGPDGCPQRMCGPASGTFALPGAGTDGGGAGGGGAGGMVAPPR